MSEAGTGGRNSRTATAVRELREELVDELNVFNPEEFSKLLDRSLAARNVRSQSKPAAGPAAPLNFIKNTLPGAMLGILMTGDWLGALMGAMINHFVHESGHILEARWQGKTTSVSKFLGIIPHEVTVAGGMEARRRREVRRAAGGREDSS